MSDTTDAIIQISDVSKVFGGTVRAVDHVTLEVKRGEFFALLGPSGCGKTTLLRMLAGFETPTEGSVVIDGVDMATVEPNKRPVNMVFQSYAVFPHMSVADNVAYGLKIEKRPRREITERVQQALDLVKLGGYGKRMPDELSGGQRQRVALARALVKRPSVLLLDEPLSALDAKLREAMQLELVRLQKQVGITFVVVTHDQSEALSMANRIAVMENGKVRQIASPSELYEAPNCRFVADFIGKINLFDAEASAADAGKINVAGPVIGRFTAEGAASGKVSVAVRPEKFRILRDKPSDANLIAVQGKVSDVAYYGGYSNLFVEIGQTHPIMADVTNAARTTGQTFSPGQAVWCAFRPEDALILAE